MAHQEYTFEAFDNRKMFVNQWVSPGSPKAGLVLVHGLGEHSGRYTHFAEFMNQHNISVYAVDLFGHGKTEGKQGHTPKIEDYLWQIKFLLDMVGQLGAPVFLYGHSMGGLLVLKYLFSQDPKVSGVVVSAPAIAPGYPIPAAKKILGKVGRSVFPSLVQKNGLDVNGISRDEAIVNAYHADPLVHDYVSAELGIGILDWGVEMQLLNVSELKIPLLLMHGTADVLTSYEASKDFSSKFRGGDVTFKTWEGFYHELHNEPEKEAVLNYVLDWIQKRIH